MEKYLYLTSAEYAVLLHLTGKKCVTGFSVNFPGNMLEKRQLLFAMYRKGIMCSDGDVFRVAPEWKAAFECIQKAEDVIWISFSDDAKQDVLFYLCGEDAVRIENLSDAEHDQFRISMKPVREFRKDLTESELFPRIRLNRADGEMMDRSLGVTEEEKTERICTFSLYANGEADRKEKVSIEREMLVYYIRIENAEGIVRRRACNGEIAHILDRYMGSEVL